MKFTVPTKLIAGAAAAAVLYVVLAHFNLIPAAIRQESAIPTAVDLSSAPEASADSRAVEQVALPTTKPAPVKSPQMRMNIWAWNAQMGLLFANGGPVTTVGSLMEKHNVSLKITRQDDTEKTKAEQVKFATALAGGDNNPSDGTPFLIIMGDGAAQYLASINKLLAKLGPDYRAEVIGAVGYSRGEDGWWGPQEWRDSPEAMKGGATAGVLRDGDWNIAQYKLANDSIKNNPDETTWDPDAMNWFNASDYLKAAEMYISGYCEDRPVARNGKLTNEPKHHICVQGVVTWTPGDVNLAKNKGGLVRLLSTKENIYQMPSVIIGIHRWNMLQAKKVQDMLAAVFEGSDQVKRFDAALSRAGQASYAVYAEQNAAYWVKYYKGVTERDKTQQPVPLGGSTVANLADNLLLFGLAEGSGGVSSSLFKATYEGFGQVAAKQYPALIPSFPKVAEAVNTTFLEALAAQAPKDASAAETESFDEATGPMAKENVVASRNWTITFETGKATFTPAASDTLTHLYEQVIVGGALAVQIDGHTDNVGDKGSNLTLSQARASAVKQWLQAKAPTLFPENRVTTRGLGDTQPLVPNDTADGRAKNRRVTISLGTR